MAVENRMLAKCYRLQALFSHRHENVPILQSPWYRIFSNRDLTEFQSKSTKFPQIGFNIISKLWWREMWKKVLPLYSIWLLTQLIPYRWSLQSRFQSPEFLYNVKIAYAFLHMSHKMILCDHQPSTWAAQQTQQRNPMEILNHVFHYPKQPSNASMHLDWDFQRDNNSIPTYIHRNWKIKRNCAQKYVNSLP